MNSNNIDSGRDRAKFMQLIVPVLFFAGLVLIGGSELAKEKWKELAIIFSITSSIGASLFAGAAVTALYNYFIKEIDTAEIQNIIRTILKNVIENILNKDAKIHRIIYFAPTLLENEFYHEVLHQLIILSGNLERKMDIVVKIPSNLNEKGIKYHDNEDGYIHELSHVECDQNTLLVVVPCTPQFHEVFPDKLSKLMNIITLDMEVPTSCRDTFNLNPSFLANIRTDNKEACKLIANELFDYFEENGIVQMNIVICEGNFHNRGQLFKDSIELENEKKSIKLTANFFPENMPITELDFGDATNQAMMYTYRTMSLLLKTSKHNLFPTFIFCANDNMGIGARNALIRLEKMHHNDPKKLEAIKNTKIICYDYSSTVRNLIKNSDEFIYFSAGQDFRLFAQKIIGIATRLEAGRRLDPESKKKELTVSALFERQRH